MYPPLLPELSAWKAAPILTNEMIRLGEGASAAKLGEGEGTLIPPLVPEIVQTNTDVILGSSPDPGRDDVQSRTFPPLSVNDNQDCDLQVKVPEADQGEAEHLPVLKPTENDPIVLDVQVRGTGTTQGEAVHPPFEPLTVCGQILGGDSGTPPGVPTGPKLTP